VKAVTIPLLHSRAAEGAKSFRVTLSNPAGGATLGASTATAYIVGSFSTIAPPFVTALPIHKSGGLSTLKWNGGGQLQRADNRAGAMADAYDRDESLHGSVSGSKVFIGSQNQGR